MYYGADISMPRLFLFVCAGPASGFLADAAAVALYSVTLLCVVLLCLALPYNVMLHFVLPQCLAPCYGLALCRSAVCSCVAALYVPVPCVLCPVSCVPVQYVAVPYSWKAVRSGSLQCVWLLCH